MSYQRSKFEKQHNQFMCENSHPTCGLHGGYYYDERKQRYIKVFSTNVKRYVKSLHNKQFRRQFKAKLNQNLDDEQLIKSKEKMYDLWQWW